MKKVFKNVQYEKYYKDLLPYLKKEKNQQYLAVILTLGATIFFALFAINPTLSTITRLRREVNDSKFVNEKLKEKVQALSSLSTEYQAIEGDLNFVYDAVPFQPEAPTLIAQIQSIATETEINLENIKVSPISLEIQSSTKSSSFAFELTGESNFENIQQFISTLINMERLISIDKISISKGVLEDSSLQLDILGSAYYKKE